MQHCHIRDTTWNPRPLPGTYGEIAENYQNMSQERHFADGWRVAVPYVDKPGYRHDSKISTVMFGPEFATEMPGALINIADEQADQAKADEETRKVAEAAEDARVLALPSIAAIVADANSLRAENADLRKKLDAAEAKLATVQATADKAAIDIAALKETPKTVEPVPK
jgi:hypothetical protein